MQDLIDYLKENKEDIEPILYTTGQKIYVDKLLDFIDPERELFEHVLYQNACYTFEKKDEDVLMLIKDISRFSNRDPKRSVLLDPNPVNFIMAPENGIPVVPYQANEDLNHTDKDQYLLTLIEDIEELKKQQDVRPYLRETYQIRRTLRNAKLI